MAENQILCKKDGNIQEKGRCEDDEWCTGGQYDGVDDVGIALIYKRALCSKGSIHRRVQN